MSDVVSTRAKLPFVILTACALVASAIAAHASATCPEEQDQPNQVPPADPKLCVMLDAVVSQPNALPLDQYEKKLAEFLNNLCHRRLEAGWKVDKRIRDTGPYAAAYENGQWKGNYRGTHAPVLVWYSPKMYEWLKANRKEPHAVASPAPSSLEPITVPPPVPIPDGAIIVKEMYSAPAAACTSIPWQKLRPTEQGAAVMIRDAAASQDGWFWGWFGWNKKDQYPPQWQPDWPAQANNPLPGMGFGQYCTNCHASAADNSTFSSLKNITGELGQPLVFLSQSFFIDPSIESFHTRVLESVTKEAGTPQPTYNDAFTKVFWSMGGPPPSVDDMPSETYDNVWVKAGAPTSASQYLTSDQCIGCHSAGGTGLQFDMTQPGTADKLINISPYGTWRGSPMGLAGRDPIFFAQLASETGAFHPAVSGFVQDACLGCHGILGQRQSAIDRKQTTGVCGEFPRTTMDAVPYPPDHPIAKLANYGALARDGISCTSCHRMVLGDADSQKYASAPQNVCVKERQAALNPGLTGFAATSTGSFLVGPPDQLFGPFQDPKKKPMKHALGNDPEHNTNVLSSELCGSCHTVHLPILHRGATIGHTYEQTTYPEWAFSDYRTGTSPDGPLPLGSGSQAQSCQGCHMPNTDAKGNPFRSKIAAIQEYTNFPQAENTLPPDEIDLPVRAGYGKHTLVGLNVFLLKMAWQFADVLGIRLNDPMLGKKGIDSIPTAENAMLDQAANKTAAVTVTDVKTEGDALTARVNVISKVGHKFPSGVGFRRAFVEFTVLDEKGQALWASGRTNEAGVIIDENKNPIAGELWWKDDCSARIDPDARIHQPHYQVVTRQDQAQIYEELLSTPPDVAAPLCGPNVKAEGRLTTSFLSICTKVKDNRILPHGFLALEDRIKVSRALGAGSDMAEDANPVAVDDDPDYRTGGGDSLIYRVPLAGLAGKPVSVQATLYYQATPPYFLQDRFCTSNSSDTKRLYYVAGKLSLAGTLAADWKLRIVTSGPVTLP
jgi:Cytochrome P460